MNSHTLRYLLGVITVPDQPRFHTIPVDINEEMPDYRIQMVSEWTITPIK